ncbi:zinc finger protein 37 homolog [Cyprinus carpio]|uniref:Zinc finger protein 37 homolog n=1 Tax=Cyprinus carpio TaxID=7962 RepID=A0A9R0B957_CYPCA|nr:zinc finger protein 37 homolog [Cyprinus carpio]
MEQGLPSAKAISQHFMNGCLKSEDDSSLSLQSDSIKSEIQVKVEPDQDDSSLLDMNELGASPHSQGNIKEEFLDLGLQILPTGLMPPVEMEGELEITKNTHSSPDEPLSRRSDSLSKRRKCTDKQGTTRKRKSTERTEQIIPTEMNSDVSNEGKKCLIMQGSATRHPEQVGIGRTSNKQHKEERFSCETCGKEFQRSDLLTDHMKIHRRQKPYACDQCEMKFAKPSYLKIHLRRHAGDRPFPCNQCEKRFFDIYDLRVHQRDHTGERPYMCSECGKSFKRVYILNKHKRTHSKERPFQCSVCGKAYRYGYSYRLHLKDHID